MGRDGTRLTEDVIGAQVDRLLNDRRDRSWEAKQREQGVVVTYRGVPRDLHEQVKEIAKALHVNTGDVARRFLEYAIEAYQEGELELQPVVVSTKRSLYPDEP
jgi:hypothetical protein